MNIKPFPALCKECKYSAPDKNSSWQLQCHNPKVNAKDSWALANCKTNGSNCQSERDRNWFSPCGQRGAQWEPIV